MMYGVIERYWFWKLDYLLWEHHEIHNEDEMFKNLNKDDHKAISQYIFKSNRSIEHLHPKNPQKKEEKWESGILDSFGNLAMISSSFNSSQSNDSISTKFGRVQDHIVSCELESIKMLLMFKFAGNNETRVWTKKKAKEHEDEMLKILGI